MNIVEIGKTALKNLDKIGIVALIAICVFLWFKMISLQRQAEDAGVNYRNDIARMSQVVQESNDTWSRLAEERGDGLDRLNEMLPELAETIRQRDEQILQLARATASIRPIVVRVTEGNGANQSEEPGEEGQPPRARVTFDSTYQEFARIHGFTLTNPAEANVSVEFVRPVNFTVATTQAADRSWRTYIQSDLPGLEIGEVESQVSPLAVRRRSWEQDIEVGIFGAAAVTGNAGIFGAEIGYDFGGVTVGIDAGGITYPGSTDFLVGGRVTLAPFDL